MRTGTPRPAAGRGGNARRSRCSRAASRTVSDAKAMCPVKDPATIAPPSSVATTAFTVVDPADADDGCDPIGMPQSTTPGRAPASGTAPTSLPVSPTSPPASPGARIRQGPLAAAERQTDAGRNEPGRSRAHSARIPRAARVRARCSIWPSARCSSPSRIGRPRSSTARSWTVRRARTTWWKRTSICSRSRAWTAAPTTARASRRPARP